jgi:hypothetical protein
MANLLEVIISGNSKELEAALSRADKQLTNFGKKASEIGQSMSLYVTAPLTLAGGAAVKLASDFNESMNKVDVSFKSSAAEVQAFAKTALTSFGIAEGTALDMAALFGDMATGMGVGTAEAAKLSTSLVGLAGDLASFKNIGIDQVQTALAGIFTGETESLKRLGIVMTEANVKAYAFSTGIKKSYDEMSQAEKVMLRYNYVLSVTKNAHGDFERTGGGAANQMRMFAEALKQVGAQFGQIVLPYVTSAFKAFNSFMVSVSESSKTTKTIIMVLGGLVAAIGPVLTAVGFLSQNMIAGFTNATKAVKYLWAAMMANPLVAITTLVAGLTSVYLVQMGVFKNLTDVQKEMNNLKDESVKSTIKEENEMQRLVKLAQNQNVAMSERKKAIEALNAMSPEYLGNITLETVGTDKAKAAMDKYIGSLRQKALVMAGNAKIQELMTKNLALQTGEADAGSSVMGALKLAYGAATGNMNAFAAGAVDRAKRVTEEIKANEKLIQSIAKLSGIDLNKVDSPTSTKTDLKGPSKAEGQPSTGYSAEFKAFQARIKATEETEKALFEIKKRMNEASLKDQEIIQKKMMLNLGENGRANVELLKKWFNYDISTSEFFTSLNKLRGITMDIPSPMAMLDKKIAESTIAQKTQLDLQAQQYSLYMENVNSMAQSVGNAFNQLGGAIVQSMGLASTGLEGFMATLIQMGVQYAAEALKQSIIAKGQIATAKATSTANAVVAGTESAKSTGPGAIFTLLPFIAMGIAAVSSAFSKVPAFAAGGIVSGPTMGLMGEYPGAKSNPEVIAPLSKLQGMLDQGNGNGTANVSGEFVLRGQDLVVALQRAEKQRNRIG